jgi:exonuclease VII large subunit
MPAPGACSASASAWPAPPSACPSRCNAPCRRSSSAWSAELRLGLLDPRLVLERGYAWLQDASGQPVTRARQAQAGQALAATLADGTLEMTVTGRSLR